MKVLICGADGQLGRCLLQHYPSHWQVTATNRSVLDITDPYRVKALIEKTQPHFIINAAAYTAVDLAEDDPEHAKAVNTDGVKNLAIAAKNCGAGILHISTDYVFDGDSSSPYTEDTPANPLNIYGKTKLDGELALSEILPDSLIIRTSWLFSEYGNNFMKTMLALSGKNTPLKIVSDQYGCPTYAGDLATAIIYLLENHVKPGLYHYCGNTPVSWYQFAEFIFEQSYKAGLLHLPQTLQAITRHEFGRPAKRPARSVLSNKKLADMMHIPDWHNAVIKVIHQLKSERQE